MTKVKTLNTPVFIIKYPKILETTIEKLYEEHSKQKTTPVFFECLDDAFEELEEFRADYEETNQTINEENCHD